jgi:hypothetical protein
MLTLLKIEWLDSIDVEIKSKISRTKELQKNPHMI